MFNNIRINQLSNNNNDIQSNENNLNDKNFGYNNDKNFVEEFKKKRKEVREKQIHILEGVILLFWTFILSIVIILNINSINKIKNISQIFDYNKIIFDNTNDKLYFDNNILENIKDIKDTLDEEFCKKKIDLYETIPSSLKSQPGSLLIIFSEIKLSDIFKTSKLLEILLYIDLIYMIIFQTIISLLLIFSESNKITLIRTINFFINFGVEAIVLFFQIYEFIKYSNSKIGNVLYFFDNCRIDKEEFRTFYGDILPIKNFFLRALITYLINIFSKITFFLVLYFLFKFLKCIFKDCYVEICISVIKDIILDIIKHDTIILIAFCFCAILNK